MRFFSWCSQCLKMTDSTYFCTFASINFFLGDPVSLTMKRVSHPCVVWKSVKPFSSANSIAFPSTRGPAKDVLFSQTMLIGLPLDDSPFKVPMSRKLQMFSLVELLFLSNSFPNFGSFLIIVLNVFGARSNCRQTSYFTLLNKIESFNLLWNRKMANSLLRCRWKIKKENDDCWLGMTLWME